MTEQEQPKNDFMHKLALQIVERRNLVFLIVILGTIFTIFSRSWVKVESDLTTYLPKLRAQDETAVHRAVPLQVWDKLAA